MDTMIAMDNNGKVAPLQILKDGIKENITSNASIKSILDHKW